MIDFSVSFMLVMKPTTKKTVCSTKSFNVSVVYPISSKTHLNSALRMNSVNKYIIGGGSIVCGVVISSAPLEGLRGSIRK